MAELENEKAAGFYVASSFGDEPAIEFVAFFAAEKRDGWFVLADFDWKAECLFAADVGRVGNYKIKENWRVRSGEWGESGEEVGLERSDAVSEAEAVGIALGDSEGVGGDVDGIDLCGGEFLGKGDRDAARARADVHDRDIIAGELGWSAGADFTNGETVESDLDQMFGFGAGNEDVGSDLEVEAPEFLVAGEVLRGLSPDTALN